MVLELAKHRAYQEGKDIDEMAAKQLEDKDHVDDDCLGGSKEHV